MWHSLNRVDVGGIFLLMQISKLLLVFPLPFGQFTFKIIMKFLMSLQLSHWGASYDIILKKLKIYRKSNKYLTSFKTVLTLLLLMF